jgi:hypothetical protein
VSQNKTVVHVTYAVCGTGSAPTENGRVEAMKSSQLTRKAGITRTTYRQGMDNRRRDPAGSGPWGGTVFVLVTPPALLSYSHPDKSLRGLMASCPCLLLLSPLLSGFLSYSLTYSFYKQCLLQGTDLKVE